MRVPTPLLATCLEAECLLRSVTQDAVEVSECMLALPSLRLLKMELLLSLSWFWYACLTPWLLTYFELEGLTSPFFEVRVLLALTFANSLIPDV